MKPRYSASQVKKFLTCPRSWWFEYIKKIKPPQKAAAALGERVHKILEEYQRYATPPNRREAWQFQNKEKAHEPGKIALEALPFIPKPKTAVAEEWFEIETKENVWIGVIDLQWKNNVLDYKTTSSLQYIKSEENLLKDPQVILYSAKNFIDNPMLNEIMARWLYLITRGKPKAKEIIVKISRSQSEQGLVWLEKVATVMSKVALIEDVNLIKSKAESCQLYGECFFTKKCNLTNQERIRSIMSNDLAADLQGDSLTDLINPPEKPGINTDLDDLLGEDMPTTGDYKELTGDELADLLAGDEPTTFQASEMEKAAPIVSKLALINDVEEIAKGIESGSGDPLDNLLADDTPAPQEEVKKRAAKVGEYISDGSIKTTPAEIQKVEQRFTLCIDCSPIKFQGQMMTLSELLEPIAEEADVPKALRKNLKAAAINPRTILVTNSLDSKEYIQILEANAGMVICG